MMKSDDIIEKPGDIDKSGQSTETSETSRDSFNEYKEMVENIDEKMGLGDDKERNDAGTPVTDICTTTGGGNTNAVERDSDLPPYMKKHAAECWFPECRDCTCCQGFKYGCACGPTNNGVCVCVTGPSDDLSEMTMNSVDLSTQHNNNNNNELCYQHNNEFWCQQQTMMMMHPMDPMCQQQTMMMMMHPMDLMCQQLMVMYPMDVSCQPTGSPRRNGRKRTRRPMCKKTRPRKVGESCRFFFSSVGCRHGNACQYSHTKEEHED